MEDPKHNNRIVFYPEVNSVGKSPKKAATKFAVHLWVKHWIAWNLTSTGIKHPKEFLSEAR
jgi:hypothetical protein